MIRGSTFGRRSIHGTRSRRCSRRRLMSKAIILQHVDYAGPGRIVPVFRDYGIPIEVRRLYAGDEVPTDLDEVRVLVVLGGSMSVKDVGGDRYPFLAPEVATLQRIVRY